MEKRIINIAKGNNIMKYLTIQEAFERKFKRQKKIKKLKYDALGSCVHIGKISPGCISCFKVDPFAINFFSGTKCNVNCIYCTSNKNDKGGIKTKIIRFANRVLKPSKMSASPPSTFCFGGGGEPLLYFDFISKRVKLLHRLCKNLKRKPWLYLYTNGILANKDMLLKLKELGFDEIRFHLGATNFSPAVYRHMRIATKYFKAITVETPAWPPHKKQLFKMLPIIEDIGVKHLNVGEIEVNHNNLKRILKAFPDAEIYPCCEVHLDDAGLVYDIMEEVIRKNFSYSVLDCNCFVKLIQRGRAKWICSGDI